jgi:putative spermidine/putrescine transport system permease protein
MKRNRGSTHTNRFDVMVCVAGVLVIVLMILPILVIVPMSFGKAQYFEIPPRDFSLKWYIHFFSDRYWRSAMFLSLQVAFMTMLLSTVLGTLASFGLVRGRFWGKDMLNAVVISPLVIPHIITALAAYFFFARHHLIGSRFALVMAHTILATPFVILTTAAALKGFDLTIERAAMGLGANRIQTFFRVTLPVIRPAVVSGAILAFITSFDELIIAIFISGTSAVTLPKQMWDGMMREIDPTVTAVSCLLIGVTVVLIVLIWMIQKRNLAASPTR